MEYICNQTDDIYTPLLRMFWNTSSGVWSLNGGTPVRNSKRQTPRAHQSTPSSVNKKTGHSSVKPPLCIYMYMTFLCVCIRRH